MATIIVGVGDFAASKTKGDEIKTFALGSCVGVVIVDPLTGTTGMLHLVLSDSAQHAERAKKAPGYFADTGIPALIAAMEAKGSRCNPRWVVKLAGGAKVLNQDSIEVLDIGKRNILAAKRNLWKFGLGPLAEDVGKSHSRTISITVGSLQLSIQNRAIGDIVI